MPEAGSVPLLVEAKWLAANLSSPNIRILDCTTHMHAQPVGPSRIESGRPDYESGHIPGALHVDMVKDLSDPNGEFPYTMPGAPQICALAQRLGIRETDHLVLYGNSAMMTITRAWLVFFVNGHSRVSILNGNMSHWKRMGLPVSQTSLTPTPTQYQPGLRRENHISDSDEVRFALTNKTATLINALSTEQYQGSGGAHYGRPGRIPGSLNLPARSVVDASTGSFRPIEEIRQLAANAGIDELKQTIHYCGGGIAASTSAFVMAMLGSKAWSVYDNSLLEWCSQPDNPMVSG